MKQYFLHRVDADTTEISSVDYVSSGAINAVPGDYFLIYRATTLDFLGVYELGAEGALTLVKKNTTTTLRDVWDKFSFVHTVNENTSRMFKKKNRQIEKVDADIIIGSLR
jgi:hypothetical protein